VLELTGAIPGGVTGATLVPLLQGDLHRPRLTVYARGGRTELSTASLANWSAKVAGLLVDELGLDPGDPVAVWLPAGWQTAPVLLGTWWAGLTVVDADAPAAAAFIADGTDDSDLTADDIFVVSGHPLGAPSSQVAAHQRDFTGAVLPQADRFAPRGAVASTDVVVRSGHGDLDLAGLLTAARVTSRAIGTAGRLLSDRPWILPDGVARTLVAALAADGSLVQVLPGAAADLAAIAAAERATVTDGPVVAGLPPIDQR